MSDTRKKIVVDADTSGIESGFNQASQAGNSFYSRLKANAESYSDNLKVQAAYIEKTIALEQRRIEQYNKQAKKGLAMEEEAEIGKASSYMDKEKVKETYKEYNREYNADYLSQKQQLLESQDLFNMEYDATRGRSKGDFEQQRKEEHRKRKLDPFRRGTFFRNRRYYGSRFARAVTGGLGIGFSMGIMGILYESVQNANEFQKSLLKLSGTMKNVGTESLSAGASIGKTIAEMSELTRQVAVSTGGTLGRSTGRETLFTAQLAKAFSLNESSLINNLGFTRMGGTDPQLEQLRLLKEMVQSGAVSRKDMAQLSEKFEMWSKLNTLQSQQMAYVNPAASSLALGAVQATKLPMLSDQRQEQFLQGLNRAITNPGNDFMRAFTFNALNTGTYVGTLTRMQEGIFGYNSKTGRSNVTDVLDALKKQFGGRPDETLLAASNYLNLPLPIANKIIPQLFGDPEKLKKLEDTFNKIGSISDQYDIINGNTKLTKDEKEKATNDLDAQIKVLTDYLKSQGFSSIPTIAGQQTAMSEELIANIKDLLGEDGSPILKSMKKFVGDPKTKKLLSDYAGVISMRAAELISKAAPIMMEAAKLLMTALEGFFPGNKIIGDVTDINGNAIPSNLILRESDLYKYKDKSRAVDYFSLTSGINLNAIKKHYTDMQLDPDNSSLKDYIFRDKYMAAIYGLKEFIQNDFGPKRIKKILGDKFDDNGYLKENISGKDLQSIIDLTNELSYEFSHQDYSKSKDKKKKSKDKKKLIKTLPHVNTTASEDDSVKSQIKKGQKIGDIGFDGENNLSDSIKKLTSAINEHYPQNVKALKENTNGIRDKNLLNGRGAWTEAQYVG